MIRHVVGPLASIPPGTKSIVTIEGREIGIFNCDEKLYAVLNRCPHQGAPVCLGSITGTCLPSSPGEFVWSSETPMLRCPWHGWEFELPTGAAIFDSRIRLTLLPVQVEDGLVVVSL